MGIHLLYLYWTINWFVSNGFSRVGVWLNLTSLGVDCDTTFGNRRRCTGQSKRYEGTGNGEIVPLTKSLLCKCEALSSDNQ